MAHIKGTKKTGGRKAGTPNRKTQELSELAKSLGVNPFEIMLLFSKGDHKKLGLKFPIAPEVMLQAARSASEYLFPKRKPVDKSGDAGETLTDILRAISKSWDT